MNGKRSDGSTPAGSVVPPTTISDELVEIAAEALRAHGVEIGSCGGQSYREHVARRILARAVPYIEAGLRAKIAAEIEAEGRVVVGMLSQETEKDRWRLVGAEDAYRDAIRIVQPARGTQEATK